MKKTLLSLLFVCISLSYSLKTDAQVFYTEDFDGALTWTLNTDLGVEDASPNEWYISCQEEGNLGPAACGTPCGAGNQTLHVSTNSGTLGDLGAAYVETGAALTGTDRRAESANISTVGESNITLDFEMIGFGEAGSDFTELFYSIDGGVAWVSLDPALGSTCCLGPCSGADQGLWQSNSYPLPAACEGIPNLRISFVWKNIDDGVAGDPSFAVDNITLTSTPTPLVADFSVSIAAICEGDCVTLTNLSTGPITTWDWTFSDLSLPALSGVGPHVVCFNNAGAQDITLTVGDGTSTDVFTFVAAVTVNATPNLSLIAAPNDSICLGDNITLSGAGATTYAWSGGITDGVSFTPAVAGTTIYTCTGTTAGCDSVRTITIVVEDCGALIAGFSYPDPICQGACVTLTDTTEGDPTQWDWDFDGAVSPGTSTDQNPVVCFDSIGVFDIQLTVEDAFGQTSSVTNQITVYPEPVVTTYADTTIDLGGQIFLFAEDTIDDLTYLWTPDYFLDCPTCPATIANPWFDTTYVITVTDTNGCTASDNVHVTVNFIVGVGVPSAFSPNGDGMNDVLYVKGIGIKNIDFSVYNRYGQRVFYTQDQSIGWDGKLKGKDENPGVFLWTLSYVFENGYSGTQNGNTTLVR